MIPSRGKLFEQVLDWESGKMLKADEPEFFQALLETGLLWSLQGVYGRRAEELLEAGEIHIPVRTP